MSRGGPNQAELERFAAIARVRLPPSAIRVLRIKPDDCAPEFARELFGHLEVGVLPRLVHSRFGLHVVEVLEREGGVPQAFDAVRGAVAMALRQQAWVTALRQCLKLLAGQASIEGVDLDAADTPLVQ